MKNWIVLGSGLVLASVALAQQAAPTDARPRADRRAEAFAESDANRDGRLSLAEFQAARSRKLAEQFQRMDGNRDGALTPEEMQDARREQRQLRSSRRHQGMARHEGMKALDKNGDQALSRAEIGDRMPRLSENFDSIDLDDDGRLDRTELRAGREALRAR
jgi:Ca2+-binding EF-hand superfamily protein